MMDSPSLCIIDANVLIDLHIGGVLDQLWRLPYTFAAPDVLIAELQTPDGAIWQSRGLLSLEATGAEVRQVMALVAKERRISTNDLFAFLLARTRKAMLLTGDNRLRQLAEAEAVTVHGTLWVLDELLRRTVITRFEAARALQTMLQNGSRLPKSDCEGRLQRWSRP